MRLKKGDNVTVLSGRDKGKSGKITAVYPTSGKVLVEGVNQVTKSRKPTAANRAGGKFQEDRPIFISKVGLTHPSKKGRASRVGYKINAKGVKTRVLKASGKEI